jgi:peptide/nickel transport system permease protein
MRLAARHLLPFVLAPATRVLAVVAGALIAATTVVETLFGYAGLGELLVAAIATRDVPVVQCVALLAAAVVLAGLLVADLVAAATDERRVSTP